MVVQTIKRLSLLATITALVIALAGLLIFPFMGTALAKSEHARIQQGAKVPQLSNYDLPSWWGGKTCDGDNYFRAVHIHPFLITSWRGIQVCGPRPYTVSTPDNYVLFPGGSTEQEFECTELVKRFLYLAYGVNAIGNTNGYQVVDKYTAAYPKTFYKIINDDSNHQAPVEGDVFSYANDPGHTSIVTSSNINSSGYGSINVIEQNVGESGEATLKMADWVIQHDPYHIGTVSSWMTIRNVVSPSNSPRLVTCSDHMTAPWVALYGGLNYGGKSLCFEGTGFINLRDYNFAAEVQSVNIAANVIFYDWYGNQTSYGYGYQTGDLGVWKRDYHYSFLSFVIKS